MTFEEIEALLQLQELDLKLIEYERHQKVLPGLLEEIEAPLRKATEAKERIEADLAVAQAQQRNVETELLANNEQFKKLQTQQMGVRNQIEYEAFQHEMEALKDRADTLEESGLKWIGRAEEANAALPALAEALEQAEKTAVAARAKLNKKTKELKRIHDEASELTAPFVKEVPTQVMTYYKRLRGAGKTPFVAVVRKEACSGCGFRHPPQKRQEIKKSKRMLTCEQCGRIQVWREEEEEKIGF